MRTQTLKRLAVVLGVFCAGLFVGSGLMFLSSGILFVEVAFADDQTQICDELRTRALQSTSPPEIASLLEGVVNYYPSGSKQQKGSRLDKVVERHRAAVVREIIAHLRRTTGEDLGESPEPWIKKHVKR
ncbi:MAG: hypothetical protein K8T91_04100 [Planctomycetes bacterium]|nr:hypothetical protein [Planctomycetota bacterium]